MNNVKFQKKYNLMKLFILLNIVILAAQSQNSPDYKYINYESYMALLTRLKVLRLNGNVFKLSDGFETYSINPRPKCGLLSQFTCKNPIIEIANFNKGDQFVKTLPILLLIGGFHGDETVGTNVLYYLIDLFEKNYLKDPFYSNLLDNVRIMLLPMANVNGIYHQTREEKSETQGYLDPNRDFPFDTAAGIKCFKTSTALLIDAIFRKNLIVGCITFHGGDNSISYPWGNFAHQSKSESGDHIAFREIAKMMAEAGSNNPSMGVQTYSTGTMQNTVYSVHGGFEDWAYGASFEKQNINKKCGLFDNPSVGLFKDNIQYDLTSNRAFIYLIEAGHNKIPPEISLGNDLPLVSQNKYKGKWGHVTRNIHLSLRFAQTMKPHAVLAKINFKSKLTVVLKVYGCIEIDRIVKTTHDFSILKQEREDFKNEFTLTLEFDLPAGTTREISVDILCDSKFKKGTLSQQPQSHLVKLRTTSDYNINFQGSRLSSSRIIHVKILNIRTDILNNSFIQWNTGNVNSLTYSNMVKGLPFASSSSEQVVHFVHNAGKLHVQTLASGKNKEQKEIAIRKYGSMASKWRFASPRHLLVLKSGQDSDMSDQTFMSLVGKDVDVYNESSNQILYTQTLAFDNLNTFEEEMNALFIPFSGVNCRSNELVYPFYFVEMIHTGNGKLNINLLSDEEEFFSFKVGNLKNDFELIEGIKFEGRSLNKYHSELTVDNFDDLRLLTRTLEIIQNKKVQVFSCVLSFRDPNVGDEIGFDELDDTVWIWEEEHTERQKNALILVTFFAILIGLIYYGIKMRQVSFSEKSENDLAVIIASASLSE